MTFLLTLGTVKFPQLYRGCGVHVVHEFVKRASIPVVKSKLNLRANMLGIINDLSVLQDDQLKNNHPLRVTLIISYAIEIH